MSSFERSSAESERGRDVPSFIEARPPLVTAPWLRPKPAHGTNLMDLYEDETMAEDGDLDLVQVYLRVKPSAEPNVLYDIRSDTVLATSTDVAPDSGRRTQCNVSKLYTFSHIFRADATQKQIFEHVVKDNLRRLTDGHSYTLLTYGASGSGKTYTLMGTVENPGLIPRSLEYLFKLVSPAQHPACRPRDGAHELLQSAQQAHELELVSRLRRTAAPVRGARRVYRRMSQRLSGDFRSTAGLFTRNTHYVWVSFVEIYNEAVYDLLQVADPCKPRSKLKISEDPSGTVYVKGATQAFVRTGAEAYDVMAAGRLNLHVAATGVHAHSSRSHCIFTITLLTESSDGVVSSCVRLCDLAGSERAERTRNAGVRMAESRAINSSLHVLERCLHVLRRKQRAANTTDIASANFLVPFRESKLTRLLGAPLSGASREAVSMVVTMNPSPLYAQETRHVLQLAAVASDICVNTTTIDAVGVESMVDSRADSEREAELLSLRADNERLNFEIQRIYARLEEAQRVAASSREQSAVTMRELVEEAREASRDYYTQQMSLQDERHKIEKDRLLKQVEALILENTKLKERLEVQPLELAVVESEIEHLHMCLAERDRADSGGINSPVKQKSPRAPVVVLDSESETDSEDSDSDSTYNPNLDVISEESTVPDSRDPSFKRSTFSSRTTAHVTGVSEKDLDSYSDSDDDKEIQIRNVQVKNPNTDTSINSSFTSVRSSFVGNNLSSQNIASNLNYSSIDSDMSTTDKDVCQMTKNDKFKMTKTESNRLSTTYISNEPRMTGNDSSKVDNTDKSDNVLAKDEPTEKKDDSMSVTKNKNSLLESGNINISLPKLGIDNENNDEVSVQGNHGFNRDMAVISKDKVNLSPKSVSSCSKESELEDEKCNNENCIDKSDITEAIRKSGSHGNFTCDSLSFSNITNQHVKNLCINGKTWEIPITTTNLLKNAVEKELTEKDTFLEPSNVMIKTEPNGSFNSVTIDNEDRAEPPEVMQNSFKEYSSTSKLEAEGILSMCRPKSWANIKIETESPEKCLEAKVDHQKYQSISEHSETPTDDEKNSVSDLKLDSMNLDKQEDLQDSDHSNSDSTALKATDSVAEKSFAYNKSSVENFDIYLETHPPPRSLSKDIENIIGSINFATNTNQDKNPKENMTAESTSEPQVDKEREDNPKPKERKNNLRLKKKIVPHEDAKGDEDTDLSTDLEPKSRNRDKTKLRNIANLQQEFSDVTLGVASTKKAVRDVSSPEELTGEENVPPIAAKSCPPKNTCSRRKLYTPRAEPLEESVASDDDSNMRVRIPRPSYHRVTRARRKL